MPGFSRPPTHSGSALQSTVRGGAALAIAAAIVVPPLRRRLRMPAAATVAISVAGPPAIAVLWPRTHTRDVFLYALQMWGFVMAHEIPYDDPEALRRRLRIDYPILADRALGFGELPTVRLQRALANPAEPNALDRVLTMAHWAWFFVPHATVAYILLRDDERAESDRHFPRAARQMAATYDLGCAAYHALPTAPPWWAAENGHLSEPVRRLMVDVGESVWGRAWPKLYDSFNGNPWAAFPSLHFGSSLMGALLLFETGPKAGAVGAAYAGVLGFALVYLGEHYVTDLLAGAALVAAIRLGEPLAEPLVDQISGVVQGLERIARA
ncbi:MAG: phosphatase PAP2 family protein [Solirubrobacterales bacterium]